MFWNAVKATIGVVVGIGLAVVGAIGFIIFLIAMVA